MKRQLWSREGLGRQIFMVVALIAVAWWGYGQFYPADQTPAASNAVNGTGATGPVIPSASLPTALKLAALDPVAGKPSADRNPFRFGVPPPPPAPLKPAYVAPPPPPPPPPYQPPPPPPGPPLIPLKFIGVIQLPNGQKKAALSDGRAMLAGFEGDVLDGRYRIVKIGIESIVLEYVDGKGRQTIPLRGTEP